jgi:hypothetical protein
MLLFFNRFSWEMFVVFFVKNESQICTASLLIGGLLIELIISISLDYGRIWERGPRAWLHWWAATAGVQNGPLRLALGEAVSGVRAGDLGRFWRWWLAHAGRGKAPHALSPSVKSSAFISGACCCFSFLPLCALRLPLATWKTSGGGELVCVAAASSPGGLCLCSPTLDLLWRGATPLTTRTPWR